MPINFLGAFIENAIVNSSIISRDHLIDLVKKYPDNIYPRLTKLLKVETEILEIVFIKNKDGLRLLKFAPFELSTDEFFLLKLIKKDVNAIGFIDDSMLRNIDFVKQVIFANPESIHFLHDQFTSIYNTFKVEFDEIEADYLKVVRLQDYFSIGKIRPLINILNLHKKGLITPKLIEKIIPIEPDEYKQIEYSSNFQFNRILFLQNSTSDSFSNVLENHDRLAEALIYLPELYKNDKVVKTLHFDLEKPYPKFNKHFDWVYNYGLLYHLKNPFEALDYLKDLPHSNMILETCFLFDGKENNVFEGEVLTQAVSGYGSRPNINLVMDKLLEIYDTVLKPTQPSHIWYNKNESDESVLYRVVIICENKK